MDSQTPNTESDFANEVQEVFTAARSGSLKQPSPIDGSSAGSASEAGAGATDVSEFSEGVRKALESSRKKYEELLGEQQPAGDVTAATPALGAATVVPPEPNTAVLKAERGAGAELQAEPALQPEQKQEQEQETRPGSEPGPKPEPEQQIEPQAQSQSEPQTDLEPEAEAGNMPEVDVQPETAPTPGPEAAPEPEPNVKRRSSPEPLSPDSVAVDVKQPKEQVSKTQQQRPLSSSLSVDTTRPGGDQDPSQRVSKRPSVSRSESKVLKRAQSVVFAVACGFRCGRRTATYFLLFVNMLFASLALGIVGSGAYIIASPYGEFFDLTHIAYAITFGVILFMISAGGCVAAWTLNRRHLIVYTWFTGTICVLQILSAVYVFGLLVAIQGVEDKGFQESNLDGSQRALVNVIQSAVRDAYVHGECTTCLAQGVCPRGNSTISIECTGSNSKWFDDFVYTNCDTDFSGNAAWDQCVSEHGKEDGAVFCSCRESLVRQMNAKAIPIFAITVALCVLEGLLVACSVRMIISKSGKDIAVLSDLRAAERRQERAKQFKERADQRALKARNKFDALQQGAVQQRPQAAETGVVATRMLTGAGGGNSGPNSPHTPITPPTPATPINKRVQV